jgi:SnoaL-like domain
LVRRELSREAEVIYCGHPLRGVHERQGSGALTGAALASVFAELDKYDATTHFVGQSTIFTLTDDRATGEAYCLGHHVKVDGGKRCLMLASLRYLDMFVKIDGSWLFAERCLYVDWLEERPLT